jgi:hypothetical protein
MPRSRVQDAWTMFGTSSSCARWRAGLRWPQLDDVALAQHVAKHDNDSAGWQPGHST